LSRFPFAKLKKNKNPVSHVFFQRETSQIPKRKPLNSKSLNSYKFLSEKKMHRINRISSQLSANETPISDPHHKRPDDVVIVSALRSCLSKARTGPLANTAPELMLSEVIKGVLAESKIDPSLIQDVAVGNCLQPGAGAVTARAAQLLSGIPYTATVVAVNRQCSSGIEACSIIAAKIKAGIIDIGLGCGVESMSLYNMQESLDPSKLAEEIFDHETARNCLIPMGNTSDNVAAKYGLDRKVLEEFAVNSHKKAAAAQKKGNFKSEIVPIKAKVTMKDGSVKEVLADQDTGIRPNATVEMLAKLKPAFGPDGITTAALSSQVTDGAAAVLFTRRSVAQKLGLPILGKFVSYAVAGVPPEIMGNFFSFKNKNRCGPSLCYPQVLRQSWFEGHRY
jgi:acetyl-CoA acyltransferase 1